MNNTSSNSVFAATRAPNPGWLCRAESEPVLEPELSIIDSHMHLWEHKTGYTYFVKEFAEDVATCGHKIDSTVFIECRSMYRSRGPEHIKSVGETEFASGMAAIAASGIYTSCRVADAIVGFADLTSGEKLRETIEAHMSVANGRFRGIRQGAKWDADRTIKGSLPNARPGLYLDPSFAIGLEMLTAMGLSFDASVFHPQIQDVATLARAHPNTRIVVNHLGSPLGYATYESRRSEVRAAWLSSMRDLAQCPNVSVKLGGLLMCLGNFDFTQEKKPPDSVQLAELWRPYIEPCIELFGANRCMASSNFPVEKAGVPYGTLWNTFKRVTAGCSEYEKKMIFSGTARRFYNMD
ncbi:amidohydrolase family protein [Advenella mimigardefordensis]|uniref:Putative amidohydrolase 2 n=1 Tax=Advenella mimigardefordensis (strain DSM 17166 / LMG 22922 / DPN7) TaxID=1247726 RepID=W0PEZ5_ADVMD|nr:amidohydrolase family protein [Advenella mimigardefordensis]AHG64122.1 putative amidohydrolase 2 [Advenella mimigardefordensis DPN7]